MTLQPTARITERLRARGLRAASARILLAEDDARLRSIYRRALEQVGYEVEEAVDGIDLLDRIGAAFLLGAPPALLIVDHRMPGASGLDVLDGLRAARWSLPVVLVTAFADEPLRAAARRLGALAVVEKPFDVDDLCALALTVVRPEPPRARAG
jgi:CheY-like chemotaxis protein